MRIKYYILIFIPFLLGCKDEFLLESKNYSPTLVVNGFITNEPPPYTVELSKSSQLNSTEKFPFQECLITIYDNTTGESENLTETEPGIYKTSKNGLAGKIGNSYSISIETPIGAKYTSEPQVLKAMVNIDTVYAKIIYMGDNNFIHGLPGYQFYMSSEIVNEPNNYFLWKLTETYQYTAIHKLYAVFDNGELHVNNYDLLTEYSNRYRCWKTENVRHIFTGKTSNLQVSRIDNHPLHFVGTDTRKLQERYSLLLSQYSISEESYNYWKNIEEQLSQENFLVATQSFDIIGNIKCLNDHNEKVYGNFTVASVTKKRIFVDSPLTPSYYIKQCSLIFEGITLRPQPVFIVIEYNYLTGSYENAAVKEFCIDCTSEGGTTEKPDFWID